MTGRRAATGRAGVASGVRWGLRRACAAIGIGVVAAGALTGCPLIPEMAVYNNTGQVVALRVRPAHGPTSDDGKLVRLAPGWSKTHRFWNLLGDDGLRLAVGDCEYAYRFPDWPVGDDNQLLRPLMIQLEPDLSLHLRTPGRQALRPDQLRPVQQQGFPLAPMSKTCAAPTPPA